MKGYIFDFDGTLVDSMDPAIDALLGFLRENEVDYPDDIVSSMLPLGYKGIAEYFCEAFGLGRDAGEVFEQLIERLVRVYTYTVGANKGVEPLLRRLKGEGNGIYLLTGSPKEFFEPCLKRLNLYEMFNGCWSVSDFGKPKSNPELYKEVAKKIGLPACDCVVIDDSAEALETASAVGMKTVGIYDKYSSRDEERMRSFVDKYIYDFTQF
ncbi:MAG: HAD family phosphatase [Clostridia bacterium]|nr:HAD family phosphatase [Clostridia bacterium]